MRPLPYAKSREEHVVEIVSSLRSQLLYKERQMLEQGDYRYVIEALRPRKQRNAQWLLFAAVFFGAIWCLLVGYTFLYPQSGNADRTGGAMQLSQIGLGVLMVWGWRAMEKSKIEKLNEAERLLNTIDAEAELTFAA